jgi:hypothetical protein
MEYIMDGVMDARNEHEPLEAEAADRGDRAARELSGDGDKLCSTASLCGGWSLGEDMADWLLSNRGAQTSTPWTGYWRQWSLEYVCFWWAALLHARIRVVSAKPN